MYKVLFGVVATSSIVLTPIDFSRGVNIGLPPSAPTAGYCFLRALKRLSEWFSQLSNAFVCVGLSPAQQATTIPIPFTLTFGIGY